ncbi:MAG: D-aminoacyl-tRNA deacylase [Salibacteraceae bacterium]
MRAVIQRVSKASVSVKEKTAGSIKQGLVVLIGIENTDDLGDVEWLCNKIINLRIFPNDEGNMNKCLSEINGNILLVSQFTLHAKTKKGNRPSFIKAAKPDVAIPLYQQTIQEFNNKLPQPIETGIFGAMMDVELTNWGPVTLIIDTKNKE